MPREELANRARVVREALHALTLDAIDHDLRVVEALNTLVTHASDETLRKLRRLLA